ncbi:MAG: hypothetical protein AAGB34_05210 [Planctomycetota bacterium]
MTKPLSVLVVALFFFSALFLGACNIVAPIAYLVEGPPKKPAVTELPPDRTAVIFIDDLRTVLPRRSLSDIIGRNAEETILRAKLLPSDYLVTSRSARRVVEADSTSSMTSIVDVGRELGAEVVIYLDMQQFTISGNAATISPTAAARVKIYDAVENEQIWGGGSGYLLSLEMQTQTTTGMISRDERYRIEEQLAQEFGIDIGRMFFEHEPESLRSRRERTGLGGR